MQPIIALAVGAHPDDIEFTMAGTLLLLKQAGAQIHMWNLANGNCGSVQYGREELATIRAGEAAESARVAGAILHRPLFDDLAIFYDQASLARVAAIVREIRPTIILTHSPQDYMEDHQNTCRLIVSAAFARGMPNFPTEPVVPTCDTPVAIYHAVPHGLRDALRVPARPDCYVDVASQIAAKREMLAQHRSQKEWLDVSQGMDAYLLEMEQMCREMGRMSRGFEFAEGWRRHLHLGFAGPAFNPIKELLGDRYKEAEP